MGANNPVAAPDRAEDFSCPQCGGQMQFDTDSQKLKCRYCGNEQQIGDGGELREPEEHPLDFSKIGEDASKDWGMSQQMIKCGNCGGEMLLPASQTASVCAFCGSPQVLPQGDPGSIRPESVIPFHLSREQAAQAFNAWRKKKWFLPNAFKKRSVNSNLNGIYVPFWTFDSQTRSSYSAEVGVYHYRQEVRTRVVNGKTETYTETVRYTVWHWTNGTYGRFFNDVLVPASGHYDEALLRKMSNFRLDQLIPYSPEYLSGFIAERYTVPLDQGWNRAKAYVDGQLESEIKSEIGGDEIRHLSIDTRYSGQTYKHILLPVWNATYMYRNETYRYMVNGETGTVSGRVPRSPWKITFFTLCCVLIAAVIGIWVYSNYLGH